MRKIALAAAAALVALSLGGCANKQLLPSVNLSNAVTLNTLQGVEATYGIALSAERAYKALPLCKTGTTTTVTNPCAKRSIIVTLQEADRKAIAAIDRANTFVKMYPTVDATNVISAAAAAVSDLKSLLATNGVQ